MMVTLKILDPGQAGAIPEMKTQDVLHFLDCTHAVVMGGGTESGKSAMTFWAQTAEGKWVGIQMSAAMLDAIQAGSVGARRRWGEDTSGAVIAPLPGVK